MSTTEIIIIAIGLSMDAFAVAISKGLELKKANLISCIITGIYFGFFQALMPCLGYSVGKIFGEFVSKYSGIITFAILAIIGINMIKESLKNEEKIDADLSFLNMCMLGIATSIDAFATGVTLSFFDINILIASSIIGSITFAISFIGVKIGNIFGARFNNYAKTLGGLILIAIAIKSLL